VCSCIIVDWIFLNIFLYYIVFKIIVTSYNIFNIIYIYITCNKVFLRYKNVLFLKFCISCAIFGIFNVFISSYGFFNINSLIISYYTYYTILISDSISYYIKLYIPQIPFNHIINTDTASAYFIIVLYQYTFYTYLINCVYSCPN